MQSKLLPRNTSVKVIVVVEDSRTDQVFIRRILESRGYHVLTAENGQSGLEALEFCSKYNLNLVGIISDVAMPKMDGLEFLQNVRRHRVTRDIPFLFLTGVDANWMWDAEKYGADGLLHKPISPHALVTKLNELLRQKNQLPIAAVG